MIYVPIKRLLISRSMLLVLTNFKSFLYDFEPGMVKKYMDRYIGSVKKRLL